MKGADSVMMNLMTSEEDSEFLAMTQQQVDAYASDGLRTLICGWRVMEEEEFEAFQRELKAAEAMMEGRAEAIARAGAVAIEDKLQSQVPETVHYLSLMGIKFWVLTGDKKETAVSIAHSTSVITGDSTVLEVNNRKDIGEVELKLNGTESSDGDSLRSEAHQSVCQTSSYVGRSIP